MGFEATTRIGVLGSGSMGSGIAQVAAVAGHPVVLADISEAALERAVAGIRKGLDRDAEKGRRTVGEVAAIMGRISSAAVDGHYSAFEGCGLVIEAILEDLAVKQQAFAAIEGAVGPGAVLATNTSSLSVTAIAAACQHPERVLGVHFFNPAPLMPLVEIVRRPRDRPGLHRRGAGAGGRLGQDHGPRGRHPGLHRQPGGASVLRRGAPDPRGGDRRPRHDRLGDARAGRLPDGPVRADGPDRERHQLRRDPVGLRGVRLRPALPALADPEAAGGRAAVRAEGGTGLLRLPGRRCGARAGEGRGAGARDRGPGRSRC